MKKESIQLVIFSMRYDLLKNSQNVSFISPGSDFILVLREIRTYGFDVETRRTKIHCKVFEDNSGAVEIANFPKARPRTKHINNRLFHFYDYVERGDVSIHHIASDDQPADFLTKPLPEANFVRHRRAIMGW